MFGAPKKQPLPCLPSSPVTLDTKNAGAKGHSGRELATVPIDFTCPHCGATMRVADQYLGQSGPLHVLREIGDHSRRQARVAGGTSTATIIVVVLLIAGIGFLACGGILVALLLPAVQSREAARRMQCSNNLKQIAIALHNYHDVYKALPPAYTVDENGNKLHSWRTLILPFVEQWDLYSQIKLDEPWDSPNNRRIAETVVPVFCCPSESETMSPNTDYMAIVGPGTVFQGTEPCRSVM